jgi:hypothetical protein
MLRWLLNFWKTFAPLEYDLKNGWEDFISRVSRYKTQLGWEIVY